MGQVRHEHESPTWARAVNRVWERVLDVQHEAPRALDAAHHEVDVEGIGPIGYYVDAHARGRPIVLLHGVHAAASAFDVKPLFEAFRGERPVYAPDLPGFGTSDRGPKPYTPELYARALERFLIDVVSPREEPVDVVALSLTSEIAARVAIESPSLFHTLTLISPTGMGADPPHVDPRRATRVERLLEVPLWSSPLYRALTSRPSVRWFLRQHFHGKVPDDYVAHAVSTARVAGAQHAPWAFVSGSLFTNHPKVALYERLRVPTLVLYDRDPHTDFSQLEPLERANRAIRTHRVVATRGLPHFERRDEVADAIRAIAEEARRGEEADARA